MPKIERLDHIALVVSDLQKSITWYKDILGLTPVYVEEWWYKNEAFLGASETIVALFQDTTDSKQPLRKNIDGCHCAFRTDKDSFDTYKQFLETKNIKFRSADYGPTKSIYFHDLDGYELEITTYEI